MKGKPGKIDARRLALLRRGNTESSSKFSAGGGRRKTAPKPITLPKLKCLEPESQEGVRSRREDS